MTENLWRRDLMKTVATAGGLLVLGSVASAAEPDKTSKLPGEWLYDGKEDQRRGGKAIAWSNGTSWKRLDSDKTI
jgi:hypothetical protein